MNNTDQSSTSRAIEALNTDYDRAIHEIYGPPPWAAPAPSEHPTPRTDNDPPLMTLTVNRAKWRHLADLLTPEHLHHEGMNECHICDKPVVDAAIERISDLERELAMALEKLARWESGASKILPPGSDPSEDYVANMFFESFEELKNDLGQARVKLDQKQKAHDFTRTYFRTTKDDLYDAQQALGKEKGKVTQLTMHRELLTIALQEIVDSTCSIDGRVPKSIQMAQQALAAVKGSEPSPNEQPITPP